MVYKRELIAKLFNEILPRMRDLDHGNYVKITKSRIRKGDAA